MTQHKIPTKILMRFSMKFLVFFMLAAGVMSSMYISDIRTVLVRIGIGSVLFILVFFINTALLSFFEKQRKSPTERIGKKVFLIGWLFTALLMITLHSVIQYMVSVGVHWEVSQRELDDFESFVGWRRFIYLSYISLILYSFIFLIQNFILHQFEKNRIEMELLKLKAINSETTNQLLQQQIQPHFLFNALNILKSLIKKYPDTAEAYLIRLSDFLRVSITGNKSGLATVKEELKLCEDYMEMQKIRFGDALDYKVEIDKCDLCRRKKLPFFSLQPLLENAIKHNELTTQEPLTIRISYQTGYLVVKNDLRPKKTIEFSTGNGLPNLRERYRLLSGEGLLINKDEKYFSVSLKLL